MEAQRAHLTGSMRVYSKVAERNSGILSSEDYSNIFPSNASMSPEIEPGTDVSENEDSGISNLDTPDHEETGDEEEVETANNKEAKENKTGPFMLRKEHRQMIEQTYNNMKKERMWKLSTGRFVEEELFKLGKKLKYEHAIHSFILDVSDESIKQHFSKEERDEIDSTLYMRQKFWNYGITALRHKP